MREIRAYENEDGTFRAEICDRVEYLSAKGTKIMSSKYKIKKHKGI